MSLAVSSLSPHPHRPIKSSISERSATSPLFPTSPSHLPLRKIPGDYGLPLIGPLRDRFDYFYTQGRDDFLRSRVNLYKSTVFRVNVPPGPFIAPDPRVIALLDAASFPTLFDTSLVEKRDLFTGTFMPSTTLTGGHRVLSYLDPSEPLHGPLKKLIFHLLSSRRHAVIPEFRRTFSSLFDTLETTLAASGKAEFGDVNDRACFDFLCRALFDRDPNQTALGGDGPKLITKWVLVQLGPLLTLGLPAVVEDLLLHTFRLPAALVRKDYERLTAYFRESASPVLEEAEKMGISRDEAVHNLLFATCFNSFGGMKILFPALMKLVGRAGGKVHGKLAEEVRGVVGKGGGELTMKGLEEMELVKSVVYEALRLEPPVPVQYGKAKRDMVVESHEAAYEVKAGEMLFGYQPFATRDGRVFERAEEFVAERFVGERGQEKLKYVVWSNGPETETPAVGNKQCAGKDFVVMVARLFLVELFLRYDSFDIEVGTSPLGSSVTVTSLKRASFF